jgi:hypothetical protein
VGLFACVGVGGRVSGSVLRCRGGGGWVGEGGGVCYVPRLMQSWVWVMRGGGSGCVLHALSYAVMGVCACVCVCVCVCAYK